MLRQFYLLLVLGVFSAAASALEYYGYKVLDKKPQSRDLFVQGLQIADGKLYVSSGGYSKSRLLRFNFTSGELEKKHSLEPRFWAEGLTLFGDKLLLLTWKSGNAFIYDKDTFDGLQRLNIPGEGWGITYDEQHLIYSDGTDRLYFLSPEDYQIKRKVQVTLAGRSLPRLNELEWIDGKIWANVWQTDRIVVINAGDGVVEGVINLAGILPLLERRGDTDVLNGIAVNPDDGGIWVTGKNWPWMYRIELVPLNTSKSNADSQQRQITYRQTD